MILFDTGKERLAVDETKVIALLEQERTQYIDGKPTTGKVTIIYFTDHDESGFCVPLTLNKTAEILGRNLT